MKNWKLPPNNPHVAKYIECYWFLEKEYDDISHNHPKLNPDPSAHLIISAQKYQYTQGSTSQEGNGSHWLFPHRETFSMDHSDPFRVIGIKFRVGALYSLKRIPSDAKLEKVKHQDINKLLQSEPFSCNDLLLNAASHPQQICDKLDQILTPWLSNSLEDKHSELVNRILPLLDNIPISQIGKTLDRSQRTIERSFLSVTNLTLKQCHSMIRLEAILNDLYKLDGDDINWADLAAKFNFSDQPHLIRHLKHSIGETPTEYASQRDLAIDVYGNFEFS